MKYDGVRPAARWLLMACVMGLASHLAMAAPDDVPASKRSPRPTVAKTPVANAKAGNLKPADASPGFTIERAPAWIEPIVAEPPSGLAPAPLQVLLSDRQRRLESTGTVSFTHVVRQINDSTGLQNGAQIEIEFDPTYEKLAIHQLTVWRGERRIDKLDRKIVKLLHRETQLERQMVDGRMTASIVVDDLRVGDRLEWAYSRRGDNPVFEGRYAELEWTRAERGPTGRFHLRLSYPAERTLQHRLNDSAVTVESTTVGGWKELVFRGRNLPQMRYDELLPATEYLKYQIELSEFADWAAVGAWGERLFARAIRSSPAVEARIAEIKAANATPDAQLLAALDFVQQDIRYFGTEIGEDSHQPATADTVLAQRFGDCKDKVALFSTLAQGLGFEAQPILVSTQFGSATRARLPSPLAFDHAIVGVKVDGRVVWLDGTRSQQSGPPTARESTGLGTGLLASAKPDPLQDLASPLDALRTEVVDTFHFTSLAKEGTLESVRTYHGEVAEVMRNARAGADEAAFNKDVAGRSAGRLPVAHARKRVGFRIGDRAERHQGHVALPHRQVLGVSEPEPTAERSRLVVAVRALRLPDQTPRTEPLQRWSEGRYRHTVKVLIDDPVFISTRESRFDEENKQFELHVRMSSAPHEMTVEGEVTQRTDRLEAAEWAAYRDKLNKVFPQLITQVRVPVTTQAEVEASQKEFQTVEERLRKGQLRLFTRGQVTALGRLMLIDVQLATGRVPEHLRAEVLTQRAIQLNHLGRQDEAKSVLEDALALDADSAVTHAALARNALFRRADATAIEQATLALKLGAADSNTRLLRVWARYMSGDFPASRVELQQIVKSRSEIDLGYAPIWLYLATRHMGDDGAAAIKPLQPVASSPAWPNPIVRWFSGQSDFDTALAATKVNGDPDPGRLCELYFYAAERALLDGDARKARELWQKSVSTNVKEFSEHTMAERELDRVTRP